MLDEATSALDSVNEKIVQDSLDEIMKGKTTISVAHRIETIKNSDMIYVFEKGQIVAYDCGLSLHQIGCKLSRNHNRHWRIFA